MKKEKQEKYYHAIHKCCERYRDMLSDFHTFKELRCPYLPPQLWEPEYKELWDFIFELMFACRDKSIPLEKANRWLGYIQGH